MPTEADRSMPLSVLFERFFSDEKECDGSYRNKFRNCLKWFKLCLQREPLVSDLQPETVLTFFKFCLRRGQSVATVRAHRTRLSVLQRYATQKGMTGGLVEMPSVVAGAPKERPQKGRLPKVGTIRHFVEFTLLPQFREKGYHEETIRAYTACVRWIERFLGVAESNINEMDESTVAKFQAFLTRALSQVTAARYASMLRVILQTAGRVEPEEQAERGQSYEELAAKQPEGSLLRFLFDNYLLERDISRGAADQLAFAIKSFSKHLGHEAKLEDLNSQAINRFLLAQQATYRPPTIKGRRGALMSIWHSAWEAGFVDARPRGVRRVKVRYSNEAWTPEEVAAIVRAIDVLYPVNGNKATFSHKGVGRREFWRSIVLAGWDSALRVGDLLRLTNKDYQVQPDGSAIGVIKQSKTGNPVKFVFRSETVEAIEACLANGCGKFAGRSTIWGDVMERREFFQGFGTLVSVAVALYGIRPATFKWIRRASVTAREVIANGLGTAAAGHTDSLVTKRHYRDAWQLPAPPPPPSILESGDNE